MVVLNCLVWRARRDLNPGSPAPEAGALVLARLRARVGYILLILDVLVNLLLFISVCLVSLGVW